MWRLAESLKKLREQVNAAYPERDKTSDGAIGDAAHASRKSDHNPWVIDVKGIGVVTAIDIDADLSPRTSVEVLVRQLFLGKDERIKYMIWNGKITTPGLGSWKIYTGPNAHKHHCHISVKSDAAHYDDAREWKLGLGTAVEQPAVNPTETETTNETASEPAVVTPEVTAQPVTHKVVAGDTLWLLSSKYQVSVSELRAMNSLQSDKILIGQTLRVR